MNGVLESTSVFLCRVLVAFALATTVASETAFAEEVDYWETATAISDQHLKNYLSQSRCYTDENTFLGCIEAINTLFVSAEKPKILTNDVTAKFYGKELIQSVDGLDIQIANTDRDKTKTPIQLFNQEQERRKLSNASWKALYKSTKSAQISIDKILSEALSSRSTKYPKAVLAAALNIYLNNVVDPHTNLWSIAQMNAVQSKSEESFFGIGAMMSQKNGAIFMVPLESSPALAAGIRRNDVLTHIDGAPADCEDFNKCIDKIKGPENTVVALTVLRAGKSKVVRVTRGKITTKNISSKMLVDPTSKKKVGMITMHSFMEDGVCDKFINLAKELRNSGAETLILDLRGNGGGSVTEVLCMAETYIDKGEMMLIQQEPTTQQITGFYKNENSEAELYNLYNKKPLVIMTDSQSASASELLPGALRAHSRVVTVGIRSFGKGTMQAGTDDLSVVGLEQIPGLALFKTINRFHFANGSSNQLVGIDPDFEVYPSPTPTEEDRFAFREADAYPNAINSSKPTVGISQGAKNTISNCVTKTSDRNKEYEVAQKSAIGGDYQVITAAAVARCL